MPECQEYLVCGHRSSLGQNSLWVLAQADFAPAVPEIMLYWIEIRSAIPESVLEAVY